MSSLQDLRYAWRNLTKTPGFLIVAVASLALGIGANTALFSLLYSALYKSLPVSDPDRLVIFTNPGTSGMNTGSSHGERRLLTWEEFERLHAMKAVDVIFAADSQVQKIRVRIGRTPAEAREKLVSGAYFSVLGLHPQLGRFFDESIDSKIGAAPFVVLSDEYWTREFGRDPSVIGRKILIWKNVFEVVGIAPRDFNGESVGQSPDFWAPLSMQMQVLPGSDFLHPQKDPSVKVMWLHVFGRLRPGATIAQAQAQASTIFKAALEDSYRSLSPEVKKSFMRQWLVLRPGATGASPMRQQFAQSMSVIFAAVGLTLLICCANLSNLLLARANTRQREIMVRLSLGASRSRIARTLFAEGLLLSFLGAGLGLVVSQLIAPALLGMTAAPDDVVRLNINLDWRVLLFTAGVAIATTLICSLVPALKAAQTEAMTTLREGGRGMTASRSKLSTGRFFVTAQVALSLSLLIGAGLFLRTLLNLRGVNLGYDKGRLITIDVDGAPAGYTAQTRSALFLRILDKLRSTPGVKGATFSENGLFSGGDSGDRILVEGYTPSRTENNTHSRFESVGPNYFSSIGIPLLLGREVDEHDLPGRPAVCLINEAFAKQFFAGRNPLGKHVTDVFGDAHVPFEVIGVTRDFRDHSLRDKVPPRFFIAFLQDKITSFEPYAIFEVRTAMPGAEMLKQVKNAVLSIDPNIDVEARFLSRALDDQTGPEKLLANLVTIFGVLAVTLAAIGIYGVLAYNVSQRTSEIGIRMAVGAAAREIVAMIALETFWIVSGGLAAGLVAAYFLTQLIQNRLFGVAANDPSVTCLAALLLGAIGLIAATIPAIRAARIDPAIALRNE